MIVEIEDGPQLRPTDKRVPWLSLGRPRYQLTEDYVVWVDDVKFVVPVGYISDLASIPRPLWWIWPPGYGPAAWAAVWHDRAYSHWYRQISKPFADEVFRQIMLKRGASEWTANRFHWAVSRFGKGGFKDV